MIMLYYLLNIIIFTTYSQLLYGVHASTVNDKNLMFSKRGNAPMKKVNKFKFLLKIIEKGRPTGVVTQTASIKVFRGGERLIMGKYTKLQLTIHCNIIKCKQSN